MTLFENLPDNRAATELTKTAFAARLGVTAGRVSQMIKEGLPVLPNGRIPVDAAESWYQANVRQKISGAANTSRDLSQVKLQREAAQRDLLLMEIERKTGAMIDRKAVELALFDRARGERDAHIAWVSRIAPALAAELGVDLSLLYAALDREMRQHLQDLSETPLQELLKDE